MKTGEYALGWHPKRYEPQMDLSAEVDLAVHATCIPLLTYTPPVGRTAREG